MRKGRARRRSKGSQPPASIDSRAPEAAELAPATAALSTGGSARDGEVREARDSRRAPPSRRKGRGPKVEDASPSAAATPSANAETSANAEVASIPPVGDVVVEEFFSEGDVGRHLGPEEDEPEVDARLARKHAPEVVERRTRLARYVTWAVGAAGVLCVAALGRGLVAPHATSSASESRPTTSVVMAAEATPKEASKPEAPKAEAPTPEPTPEPAAATTTESAKLEAAPPTVTPESAAPAKTEPTAEAPKVEADPKAAAKQKAAARSALEAGRVAAAVEAGEKSVALDPSDGEAWLLLGAAYQEKGAISEARRCYLACVKQGKRGPIGECSAMLR